MERVDFKVDKTAFLIGSLKESSDEKEYWLSKTPLERLEAMEWMRQVIYAIPATARLQRFFEVAQRSSS
ncbi:MAG: hypothetical protein Fur0022_12020 [Anaerolineales bacterium]